MFPHFWILCAWLLSAKFSLTQALHSRAAPEPPCCFSLESAEPEYGIVKQSSTGELRINSTTFRQAFLCLNPDTHTLQDGIGNSCFVRRSTNKFQCLRGVQGETQFGFATTNSSRRRHDAGGDGGATTSTHHLLRYDSNHTTFLACPAEGPGSDGSLNLFAAEKDDADDCVPVELMRVGGRGSCDEGTIVQ